MVTIQFLFCYFDVRWGAMYFHVACRWLFQVVGGSCVCVQCRRMA
jgi:hypothetical protein